MQRQITTWGSGKEKFGETDENCIPDKEFPAGISNDVAGDTYMNNYITKEHLLTILMLKMMNLMMLTNIFNKYAKTMGVLHMMIDNHL